MQLIFIILNAKITLLIVEQMIYLFTLKLKKFLRFT